MFSNRFEAKEGLDADRVFERFYRGDPSRTSSGAGLGLAIARQACEAMDIGVSAKTDGMCSW